jgi:hypothetical protein
MLSTTKLPLRAAQSSSSQLPHRPQATLWRNHALQRRLAPAAAAPVPSSSTGGDVDVDVVVVGSGIIGLLVTRQLLLQASDLSVALFDVKQPCAGATGAGVCVCAGARLCSVSCPIVSLVPLQHTTTPPSDCMLTHHHTKQVRATYGWPTGTPHPPVGP